MQQLKELPTNKFVELDSKILKNFVKPIIEFFEKENFIFSIESFYIMKFSDEKAIIYYCHEENYWAIVNFKFIDNKRNLFLGFELAKRSILQEKSLAYLNLDLEID